MRKVNELCLPDAPTCHVREAEGHYLVADYRYIKLNYDPAYHAVWCTLKSSIMPYFSQALLGEIRAVQDSIATYCQDCPHKRPRYIIWQADNAKVFNLGLDAALISDAIKTNDIATLRHYLRSCMDVFYINAMKLGVHPMVTMCLLRGKAYGAGLDAALSNDIVIAERRVRLFFPEAQCHLLPAYGSLKALVSKYQDDVVQETLFDERRFHLTDLLNLGFLDEVVKVGEGRCAVVNKLKEMHRAHQAHRLEVKTPSNDSILSMSDLVEFENNWVQEAVSMDESDLHHLDRIAKLQSK